ncbi:hypothetical protein QC762_200050 [Podospora pseudocomata]|uniref:Uncharacterized protein n=1 Tax=Podospora pseudocomata TaxID=2093779 RepID=A0ABR0GQ07_9PEZI|nr:hypothetical protein QC762_200050 [Podospora pseudocomata]
MLTVPPVHLRSSWFTAAARLHCITVRPADHSSGQIHAPRPTLNTVRPVSGSTRNKMPPFPKPNEEPPAHRMVYFPDMTTALPSESGEFRRVLWTGLYSQVVLMTVPVGGDIGEEACITSQFTRWIRSSPSLQAEVLHRLEERSGISKPGTWSSCLRGPSTSFSILVLTRSFCTPSTRLRSTRPPLCTRPRKKETRPRRRDGTSLLSGASGASRRMRRIVQWADDVQVLHESADGFVRGTVCQTG